MSMQFCQENNFITTSNKSSQPVTPQSPKVQPSCNVFSQKIESSAPIQDDQPFRSKCNSHLIDREVIGHSHVAVEAPPADAGQESDDQARLLQDVNGRHGSHEDRFWSSAAGKDLQDSVGPGTVMGDMVCSALRAQPQVRAPGLLALRGNESGACRAHPAGHSCDQPRSKDQDAGRFGTKSRAMPKSYAAPKSKAVARPSAIQEDSLAYDYDLDPENFEVIPDLENVASQNLPEEGNPHVLAMEQRLYQMENVMARVIQHLESQAQTPEAVDQ